MRFREAILSRKGEMGAGVVLFASGVIIDLVTNYNPVSVPATLLGAIMAADGFSRPPHTEVAERRLITGPNSSNEIYFYNDPDVN